MPIPILVATPCPVYDALALLNLISTALHSGQYTEERARLDDMVHALYVEMMDVTEASVFVPVPHTSTQEEKEQKINW